jgi:hypothetical membrane protein
MKTKYLLYLGFLIPVIFWTTTIACGLIIGNYNHLSGMVSELGALGTRSQYLFTAGLTLCAVLNILFVIGLYRTSKEYKINATPVMIILLYSFLAGPAIFPMPLRLHGIVGIPFPFMMLSPLMSLVLWNGNEQLLKIRQFSIYSLLIMVTGFLIFMPDILSEYFGLKQRFLYIGWSVWSVYLGYRFSQLNELLKPRLV